MRINRAWPQIIQVPCKISLTILLAAAAATISLSLSLYFFRMSKTDPNEKPYVPFNHTKILVDIGNWQEPVTLQKPEENILLIFHYHHLSSLVKSNTLCPFSL